MPASTSFAAYSVPGADSTPEMGTAVTCPFRDYHRKIGRKEMFVSTKLLVNDETMASSPSLSPSPDLVTLASFPHFIAR